MLRTVRSRCGPVSGLRRTAAVGLQAAPLPRQTDEVPCARHDFFEKRTRQRGRVPIEGSAVGNSYGIPFQLRGLLFVGPFLR